jgi:beta propeller repeat protein
MVALVYFFRINCVRLQQNLPAISGGMAVWQDQRDISNTFWDIYGYNLTIESAIPISTGTAWERNPAISDNVVVWDDTRRSHADILFGPNVPQCVNPPSMNPNNDCKIDMMNFTESPHSGENPVKICSELWQTMGNRGVCAPINGIKKAILEILSRFRSWCPSGHVGSTPSTRTF